MSIRTPVHGLTCLVSLLILTAAAAPIAAAAKTQLPGIVVDDKGRPVAGATVSGTVLTSNRQGQQTFTTFGNLPERTTDADGAFRIELTGARTDLTVRIRARHKDAFTARPLELQGDALEKPITLKVSPSNARALRVRVLDEEGKPVAGAAIAIGHRIASPPFDQGRAQAVETARRTTDDQGRLRTPPCLDPDGGYRIEVKAEGFAAEKTPWKEMAGDPVLDFGDVTLRKQRELRGQVLDRQGKPVAGARVRHVDTRQQVEAICDDEGRFTLKTTFFPPGLLFVDRAAFRFHGQRSDRPEGLKITLVRREEKVTTKMATLPPALPRSERRKLAARVLDPVLRRVRNRGDDARLRTLEILGRLDPGRLLAELERSPLQNAWFDSYVRRGAVEGLRAEFPQEAQTLIASMKDASFRGMAYFDLCDALPDGKRAEKIALLDEALLHSRAIEESDHRIINLAFAARRLWALGEKERARKLFREGKKIARQLPTAGWAGYARAAFAEELAIIDLDAALELMKDLKDPREQIRHHGNVAHIIAGTDPAAAERIFDSLLAKGGAQGVYQRDQYAIRVCYRMAPADLARARKIAEKVIDPYFKARAYGVMAQALARSRPQKARELLEHSFDLLDKQAASGKDSFNNYWDAPSLAGLMLPAAEEIDPTLVPEFFWRALSLHRPAATDGTEDEWRKNQQIQGTGALALVLARYDRELAMVLVEEARKQAPKTGFNRQTHLQAAALADPRRAAALVEEAATGENMDYDRQLVVGMLLAEDIALWKRVHDALAQWYIDVVDL
jgi:uncharacterized GH25 family protein